MSKNWTKSLQNFCEIYCHTLSLENRIFSMTKCSTKITRKGKQNIHTLLKVGADNQIHKTEPVK